MGIMDTLKGMLGGKASAVTDKVGDAIDTAADKADAATGGKAGDAIGGAAEKAKDAVENVLDDTEK